MKPLLLLLLASFSLFSCKKAIEQQKEDVIIKIMVSGQWTVSKYTKGDTTVTAAFSPYRFQFRENGTVDAMRNNAVEKTGTWVGNAAMLTIYSNFTNAAYPLTLLNGTFRITDSGLNYVEATYTLNGEVRALRLDK
jgi:hypothetical protein